MKEKIFTILIIITFLFSFKLTLAQEDSQTEGQIISQQEELVNQENIKTAEIDRLFTVYQITNDSVNRLINIIAVIATIFGVFITALLFIIVFKQISADKEIKEYKEAIKQNKIIIENETKKRLEELEETGKRMTAREEMVEKKAREFNEKGKELISSEEVKNLRKEIENLKRDIDFQKGRFSLSVSGLGGGGTPISYTSPVIRPYSNVALIKCPKCFHDNPAWVSNCEKCGEIIPKPGL